MQRLNDSLYSASIPTSVAVSPGIDYYITATDSVSTSSSPRVNPNSAPHQIAILPNEKPLIVHTPVASAPEGEGVTIRASIIDNTNRPDSTSLFYRQPTEVNFTYVPLVNTGGNLYEGVIPGADVRAPELQYDLLA